VSLENPKTELVIPEQRPPDSILTPGTCADAMSHGMTVNLMCPLGWAVVPTYAVKHWSGCSGEGVWARLTLTQVTLSKQTTLHKVKENLPAGGL
jgi:hypothetical protein